MLVACDMMGLKALLSTLFVISQVRIEAHTFCGQSLASIINKTDGIGGTVTLHCDCLTGQNLFEVQWDKSEAGTARVVSRNEVGDRELEIAVNATNGGQYKCSCEPCSEKCTICFGVNVKPYIVKFSRLPQVVQVHDSFNLTCLAVGYPQLKYKIIQDGANGKMLPLHHGEGGVWALVNALIKKGDTEERSYHCLVSNDVGFNRSSTTVIVYDPPRIVEHHSQPVRVSPNTTAVLDCLVKYGSSLNVNVSWYLLADNARILVNKGTKYSFSKTSPNNGVLKFVLLIHGISASDFGRYECKVASYYNETEDRAILSITTDEGTIPTNEKGCGLSSTTMVLIIVLVLVVCFVVLAVSAASFHLCYRKFKGNGGSPIGCTSDNAHNDSNGGNNMELTSISTSNLSEGKGIRKRGVANGTDAVLEGSRSPPPSPHVY